MARGEWLGRPRIGGVFPCVLRAGVHGPVCGSIKAYSTDFYESVHGSYITVPQAGQDDKKPTIRNYDCVVTHWPAGWRLRCVLHDSPGRKWTFLRPNPVHPLVQEVTPSVIGTTYIARNWLTSAAGTPNILDGHFEIAAPLTNKTDPKR